MQTITSIFNESLKREKKTTKRKPSIQLSMLGTKCERKLFYSRNKVPEDYVFPLKNSRIGLLGDYVEKMIADKMREAGVLIDYHLPDGSFPIFYGKEDRQFQCSNKTLGINLSKIDLVLNLDNELWLGEIKSANERTFKDDLANNAPKSDHFIQTLTNYELFNAHLAAGDYAHISALKPFQKAKGFRIFYYNKNDSTPKELVFEADQGQFDAIYQDAILARIERIRLASELLNLPERTPDYCNSCAWGKKCDNNEIGFG